MNTKQIEELTGISRQNIRYYERMGLLEPKREAENKYRDYSEEDVRHLRLIKMLRMLDMSVEDIGKVIHRETTLAEAVEAQREILAARQKQLQAAIDMCGRIGKSENPGNQVEQYLNEMEYLQTRKGGFAQIYDDYRQVAAAAEQRQFSFQVPRALHSEDEIWNELENYGEEQGIAISRVKCKSARIIKVEDAEYEVHNIRTHRSGTGSPETVLVCTMCHPETAGDAKIPVRRKKMMQVIYEIFRNIRRQRWKSMLAAAVCAMMVCFMALCMGNIDSNRKQFAKLPEIYEITGQVKNLEGSQNKGNLIPERYTTALKNSPYIKAYKETVTLAGNYKGDKLQLTGTNSLSAVESLKDGDIRWLPPTDNLSFFKDGGGCIADEMYLLSQGLEVGDEIEVDVRYYDTVKSVESVLVEYPLKTVRIKIMGSTALTDDDLLCPIGDVKRWFEESEVEYRAGSAAFTLKKPETLNSFKREMKEAGFLEVSSTAQMSYKGNALSVDDLDYITSARNLRKSIRFLTGFYPFLLGMVLLMGYMVSWLLLQSRRMELAIMKSLGTGNFRITLQIFAEHMILAAGGCAFGIILNLILGWGGGSSLLKITGLFMACYGVGTMVSLEMIQRIGVMAMLSGKE